MLLRLRLCQPLVEVLDDLGQVLDFPRQVAVPLEEMIRFLLLVLELLPQLLDGLVPLQDSPAG